MCACWMLSLIMNLLYEDSYQFQISDSFVDAQQFQLLKFDVSWQDVDAEFEITERWIMEIGLQRLPKTLPTLLQMWRLDGAFWRKNSHFLLGMPLSIAVMLPLLYRYMASGCNSILKKIWESLTHEFFLIRWMKAIFWWHILVDPWKVLWMSKFGCSDIVWVQFIQYTQFFYVCCFYLEDLFLLKHFTFLGWSLASSGSGWRAICGAYMESCSVSASLWWATSFLQYWSRGPGVWHLFMTFWPLISHRVGWSREIDTKFDFVVTKI